MMKSKKGATILTFVLLLFIFILFWIFALSDFLTLAGENYIEVNSATGLEAFFYSNLNFVVLIGLVLALLMYGVIG